MNLVRIAVPLFVAAAMPADSQRTKINSRDGLTYIWIAPGSYMMGCSTGDRECYDWEMSPHTVSIPKGFWLGETEVTQQAYERVTGSNPSRYHGPRLPVEQIG